jgi:hypothetical protein
MSEPLDLEPIRARDAGYSQDLLDGWADLASRHAMVPERAIIDRRALLAEVDRLRTELARHALALEDIVQVLGPDSICDCDHGHECGLPIEATEALEIARYALSPTTGTNQPERPNP